MLTETRDKGPAEAAAAQPTTAQAADANGDDATLRSLAVQHLERVRKFKLDLAVFLLGTVVIGAVWAITEYENSGGWPHGIGSQGNPGDWNPWFFWVVLGWGFLVGLDALKTYFRRPTTQAEIDREVERLKARS